MIIIGVGMLVGLAGSVLSTFNEEAGRVVIATSLLVVLAMLVVVMALGLMLGAIFTLLGTTRTVTLIPKTLFLRSRMRVTDLVLIVALLGNAGGMLFSWMPADLRYAVPLCAGLLALWILGGSAWGINA